MKILKDQATFHLNTASSLLKPDNSLSLEQVINKNKEAKDHIKAALSILSKL